MELPTAPAVKAPRQRPPKPSRRKKPTVSSAELLAPIPRSGIRNWQYRLNRRLKRDTIPPLGKADKAELALLYEGSWLRYLSLRPDLKCVAVFLCDKGGASKSTTAVGVGSVLSFWSRKSVYAMPATTNLKTSYLAAIAGIEPSRRYTIAQYYSEIDGLVNTLAISSRVVNNEAGLNVIAENEHPARNASQALDMFTRVSTHLRPHVDFLLLDSGNDESYTEDVSATVAAMEIADVAFFTATVDNAQSMNALPKTRDTFLNMQGPRLVFTQSEHLDWMSRHTTEEKARLGLTLISKTHPDDGPETYRDYSLDGQAVLTVPFDQSIAVNGSVDLDEISDETMLAYTKAAVCMLETVAAMRKIELPPREQVLQIPKEFRSS
jgi:hypothetical protein